MSLGCMEDTFFYSLLHVFSPKTFFFYFVVLQVFDLVVL